MIRADVIRLLTRYNLEPRQSLGQNFIVDPRITEQIAELAAVAAGDTVIEIGPGLGALTECLLAHEVTVWAIEIDRNMAAILRERLPVGPKFRLFEQDALKVDLTALMEGHRSIKVCANLPYNLTTALFVKILRELPLAESVTLMVQKEAAQRLLSLPGTGQYGPPAILASLYGNCVGSFDVPPHAYYPQPGVASRVFSLRGERRFWNETNAPEVKRLADFLEICFAMRRKTCWNNLRETFAPEVLRQPFAAWLNQTGLNERVRPEQINPTQFWQLFRFLIN